MISADAIEPSSKSPLWPRPVDAQSASPFEELRLEGVTRQFGEGSSLAGLHHLSLTVQRGEFIVLLGPSGCGKSTALNCIAGLLELTSGSIFVDQRRVDLLPPEKRGFGMVFQSYALFPHMTVAKNVAFGLLMRGLRGEEVRKRVDHALELVKLVPERDRLPGQLSGGQQQRVAIARAIVIEPPLVLMDEPLSNLDAQLRLEMRGEIRRIHRELGRATIYVTHDQDEALSLADRIVVMRSGLVQQVGTPAEVYARPANLDVARFMGCRNLLDFDVERIEGERVWLQQEDVALRGRLRQPLPNGRACAAIRPEEISLSSLPADNSLPARVTSIEYCGRDWLVELDIASGQRILARTGTRPTSDALVHAVLPEAHLLVFAAREA